MPSIGIVSSSSREVPDAPTLVSATNVPSGRPYNNGRVDVVLTAPSVDGGLPIDSYKAVSNPTSYTSTPSISLTQTVTGLASGTPYTFNGYATNPVGDSLASGFSGSVTPTTIPQNPTIGTATDVGTARSWGDGAITVSFTAGNNGGAAISQNRVTSTPSSFVATGAASPLTVTGLASNTSYTFTAASLNANSTPGYSLESASSSLTLATTIPNKMATPTATAGNALASVAFTLLTGNNTGGKAITLYTVTSTPGSFTGTGTATPISVTGLTNGTAYTFKIKATNANGTSIDSDPSNSVSPVAPYYNPYYNPVYYNPPPAPIYFNPVYYNPPPAPVYFNPPPAPIYFNPVYYNPPPAPVYFNPPPAPVYYNPKAPSYKCIHGDSKLRTKTGYIFARDLVVGDTLLTVDPKTFKFGNDYSYIDNTVLFTEVTVTTVIAGKKKIIRFNNREELFSDQQPVYIKDVDAVRYVNTSDVKIGSLLVLVKPDGSVVYERVDIIDVMDEDTVYEIRTTPNPWFIVGEMLVAS